MNYICSENFQWKKRIFDGKCSQFKDPALHETNLVAFLRGDPDPDQRSKICLDHVHQRNRWIYDQSRFTGSFDVSWSRQMDHWFGSWPPNHPDHPKTPHSKEMYSTWFGDDVIRFAPSARGGGRGVQLRCNLPGLNSHKTRLKTALWLRSTSVINLCLFWLVFLR